MNTVLSQILEVPELEKQEECFPLSFDWYLLLEEPQNNTARIPCVSQNSLLKQFSFSIPLITQTSTGSQHKIMESQEAILRC